MPFLYQKVLKIKSTLKKKIFWLHCSAFSSLALYIYNKNNFHHWLTITILGTLSIHSKYSCKKLQKIKIKIRAINLLLSSSSWPNMCHSLLNPLSLLPLIYQYTNFILMRHSFLPTLIITSSLSKPRHDIYHIEWWNTANLELYANLLKPWIWRIRSFCYP